MSSFNHGEKAGPWIGQCLKAWEAHYTKYCRNYDSLTAKRDGDQIIFRGWLSQGDRTNDSRANVTFGNRLVACGCRAALTEAVLYHVHIRMA